MTSFLCLLFFSTKVGLFFTKRVGNFVVSCSSFCENIEKDRVWRYLPRKFYYCVPTLVRRIYTIFVWTSLTLYFLRTLMWRLWLLWYWRGCILSCFFDGSVYDVTRLFLYTPAYKQLISLLIIVQKLCMLGYRFHSSWDMFADLFISNHETYVAATNFHNTSPREKDDVQNLNWRQMTSRKKAVVQYLEFELDG